MIFIALGANLSSQFGSPEETLRLALKKLDAHGVKVLSCSRIWLTEPVPVSDQPLYRNAVASISTELSPHQLLSLLHTIEAEFGRIRSERNEARVIDLDLIAYNDAVINSQGIQIPHPRMHERAFVLVPLQELSAEWRHPVLDKTAEELLALLPNQSDILSMREVA